MASANGHGVQSLHNHNSSGTNRPNYNSQNVQQQMTSPGGYQDRSRQSGHQGNDYQQYRRNRNYGDMNSPPGYGLPGRGRGFERGHRGSGGHEDYGERTPGSGGQRNYNSNRGSGQRGSGNHSRNIDGLHSPGSDVSSSPQEEYYRHDRNNRYYTQSSDSDWGANSPSPRRPYNQYSDSGHSSSEKRRRDQDPEVHLSKTLSFLLRHGAEKQGFKLMPGGYLYVDEVLELPSIREFSLRDVERIVKNNDKQRFALKEDPETKRMMIRANQGHSLEVEDLDLKPITSADEVDQVIHGTYFQSWELIKQGGLNRMKRNHIHFAAGEPGENGVISGMRSSCEVIIFINMKKALSDGLKFYRSANNVILSPGDKNGFIYPAYFDTVVQRYPRRMLQFDSTITKDSAKPTTSKGKKKKKEKKRPREEDTETWKSKNGKQMDNEEESQTEEQTVKENDDYALNTVFEGADEDDVTPENWEDAVQEQPSMDTVDPVSGVKKDSTAARTDTLADKEVKRSNTADTSKEEASSEDVVVEEEYEVTLITDVDCCRSALDNIKSEGAVAVCCYGHSLGEDSGCITQVLCVSRKKCFLFMLAKGEGDPALMTEGNLQTFLTSRDSPKVFYDCSKVSKTLYDQFDVILNGADIYDTMVVYESMKDCGEGNMDELKRINFKPDCWPPLPTSVHKDNEAEERDRCVAILKAYESMTSIKDHQREWKKEIYANVNSLLDKEELKKKKDEKKKLEKAKQQDKNQQQPSGQTSGKKNKRKK